MFGLDIFIQFYRLKVWEKKNIYDDVRDDMTCCSVVFSFICLFCQGRRRHAVGIPRGWTCGRTSPGTAGPVDGTAAVPVAGGRPARGRVTVAEHGAGVGQSAVERRKVAAVGGRVDQPRVGRRPALVRPAAEGRRRGVRLDRRTVGQRPGDRVGRVRRQRGGQRGGGRGGQQRGARHGGPRSGVGQAPRQAGRERRAAAAGRSAARPGGHVLSRPMKAHDNPTH